MSTQTEKMQVPAKQLNADALDRISFQLSLLYRAGVPSEESIALLAEDLSNPQISDVLAKMAEEMGEGKSLSEAAGATGLFPSHFMHMLAVGEASGKMDQVLAALSAYYRREAETQSALRRALTYPAMMAGLVVVVFAIMLSQVLPVFAGVFAQMGVELPAMARALLSFGNGSAYLAGILCVVLLVGTVWFLLRAKQGKGLPVGKTAAETMDRGQFASAMSMLIASGLSLEGSLDYAEGLLGSSRMTEKVRACRAQMNEGVPFAKALEVCNVFSPLQSGLLAAGIRIGDTERAMDEVAGRCVEESSQALAQFVSRLEFVLILALCTSVGLVLLSVMLPLVGILSAIG